MKKLTCCFVCIFLLIGTVAAQDKEVKLKIVQTSDIHGNFYPRDFILQRDAVGSLARVYAFVQKERETYKDNLILLDNAISCKGSPTAYYYNYIDTVSPHVAAEMLNFMGYNAGNMATTTWKRDVPCSTVGRATAMLPYWVPTSSKRLRAKPTSRRT